MLRLKVLPVKVSLAVNDKIPRTVPKIVPKTVQKTVPKNNSENSIENGTENGDETLPKMALKKAPFSFSPVLNALAVPPR